MKASYLILDNSQAGELKPLVNAYPYGDFRNCRILTKDEQDEYLLAHITGLFRTKGNRAFVCRSGGKIEACLVVGYLDWDSKILDKDMWRFSYFGGAKKSFEMVRNLLSFALENIDREAHCSCRVDICDIAAIHALESTGFRLMDTILTWVFHPAMPVPALRKNVKVRDFREKDLKEIVALAQKSFSSNRFHLDYGIENKKADKLYCQWVRNYCLQASSGLTGVKVAERNKKMAGFLAYKLNKELDRISKVKVIGQGLMAVAPFARGAGLALVEAAASEVIRNYDLAEFDALLSNNAAIKIYEKFNFKFVKARHTFHYFGSC